MVSVKLKGLKISTSKGRWYVYRRADGEKLIQGFKGTRAELQRKMEDPSFIGIYNRARKVEQRAGSFGTETLGGLVHWYTNGDIDRLEEKDHLDNPGRLETGYPKWHSKLSRATRKDYLAAFHYLRADFDTPLADIEQPDLYELRDACANKKWPRFADKMIAALSSAFKQGVKRGHMKINPCLGMDKIHEADPNANREWFSEELQAALTKAPAEVLTCLMLARYAGLRGQTLVGVNWKQLRPHPKTGMAIQLVTRKNSEPNFLPVLPELQEHLSALKRTSTKIAVRDDGTPWANEVDMQTRVSHWLRDLERAGEIGEGTTLHGLRVSYAAWWKRVGGANNSEIADLLGDRSERMGAHYTRHVEREVNIIRAFNRLTDKT
ncbi:tyrosine-type recombinase/integrase [Bradyrhizobium sp. 2S1]|uniref:tyrosine-type recombinase/integrase n=1 Tax=Bradyrhizobium sp. 2S1 TaxID=1404429 RepID=UPI00140E10BF|nr:integrase [Bradyrhizobium sp. 2S1]MCK7671508.1 integrase [Bradyrhizobium sp. 2S1]